MTTHTPVGAILDSALDHLTVAEDLLKTATGDSMELAAAHAAIAQSLALASLASSARGIAEALGSVIAPAARYPVAGATEYAAIRLTHDRNR